MDLKASSRPLRLAELMSCLKIIVEKKNMHSYRILGCSRETRTRLATSSKTSMLSIMSLHLSLSATMFARAQTAWVLVSELESGCWRSDARVLKSPLQNRKWMFSNTLERVRLVKIQQISNFVYSLTLPRLQRSSNRETISDSITSWILNSSSGERIDSSERALPESKLWEVTSMMKFLNL